MGSSPGGGFGDGPVVNWHSYVRPFEAGALGLIALLLLLGLSGGDWIHGTSGDLSEVFSGLKSASVGNATGPLSEVPTPRTFAKTIAAPATTKHPYPPPRRATQPSLRTW